MPDNNEPTGRKLRRLQVSEEYELLALEMFATSGFHNVTVDEIAEVAGVSTRTLFRYFPAKEDFLLAMTRRWSGELRDALMAIGPTDDPVGAIWDVFLGLTKQHAHTLDRVLLWQRAALGAPEVLARAAGEQSATIGTLITQICADSFDWDVRTDIRPRVIGSAINGALGEVLAFWIGRGGQDDLQSLYRAALESTQIVFSDRAKTSIRRRGRNGARL